MKAKIKYLEKPTLGPMSYDVTAKQVDEDNVMNECTEKAIILNELSNNLLPHVVSQSPPNGKETDQNGFACRGETLNKASADSIQTENVPKDAFVRPSSLNLHSDVHADGYRRLPDDCGHGNVTPQKKSEVYSGLTLYTSYNHSLAETKRLVDKRLSDHRESFPEVRKKSESLPSCSVIHDSDMTSHDVACQDIAYPDEVEELSPEVRKSRAACRGLVVYVPITLHGRMSKKHIAQIAAMSFCGFILVFLILAWVFSPLFFN